MPPGEVTTAPRPRPALITLSVQRPRVNVAVTDRAWLIVTEHVPVPVHAPLHPVNVVPVAGVAVSVTLVPVDTLVEQAVAQTLIPAGALVTVPSPEPSFVTVKVQQLGGGGTGLPMVGGMKTSAVC